MKISKVDAYAIRTTGGKRDVNREPGLVDYGDYVMASDSWTSLYPKHLETCLVRIETDDGFVGWGESFTPVSAKSTARIVEDLCRTVVLGQDVNDVEYLWYRGYSAMRERGHITGFYVDALSGVDQALWDILGKGRNQPVHRLIGGRYRDRVRAYGGIGGMDVDALTEEAGELADLGYTGVKLHLRVTNREIVRIIDSVRNRVGPDVDLMVDVHMTRDTAQAIRLGKALEEYDVRWLEAPVAAEDSDGHAEVARALDMQVSSGEWLRTGYEWMTWLRKRSVDCAMPDIGRTGITEGKRISHMCDLHNIPVAPHVGAGFILAIASGVHVSAAIPRFQILEHSHSMMPVKSLIAKSYPDVVDGYFILDDKPGLGVDIDEDVVRELAF